MDVLPKAKEVFRIIVFPNSLLKLLKYQKLIKKVFYRNYYITFCPAVFAATSYFGQPL